MRRADQEIDSAMEHLGEALGSLQHDATVQILEQIIQEFVVQNVPLHDFILALSSAVTNLHGDGAIEVIRHLEEAAAEADKVRSPMKGWRRR